MSEDRVSISSSRISAFDVSRASFAVVRRGFDTREVRSFLEMVSHELEDWELRDQELRRELAAAEDRALHPILGEDELHAALGHQSAQVLRTAHDEARHLLESAQQQANEMIQSARLRASAGIVDAEQKAASRVGEAQASAETLEQSAQAQAAQIINQAKADGETLVARAREQGRLMVEQAQEARARVLGDMNAKRRMMHVQIEQLRAARDELAHSVIGVRETIDRLSAEIGRSDETARAAAQEVARRQPTSEELGEDPSGLLAPEAAATPLQEDSVDAAVPSSDEQGEAPESQVVEELFAKIRAGARGGADEADASSDRDETSEPSEVLGLGDQPEPAVQRTASSGPDAGAIAARDGALSAPRSTLTRKIKRTLQDEQNRLLEALRHAKSGEELVASTQQSSSLVASAAVDPLGDAARAGKGFAHDHGVAHGPGLSQGVVVSIAESLGNQISAPLQRKLDDALRSEDPTAGVNGAFREWRGARLDRVVGDAALEAFSAAIVAAVGTGIVRWATGGPDDPCPDCADNELEGPVTAGSAFPTGQTYPPAHAGCRCTVLPVLP